MKLFDIIGPIMVGPSSSHTAGAVRIGYVAHRLMGEPIVRAEILLYGSFYATGRGHGTDRAIVAGLLGMKTDDERIPYSIELAEKEGMELVFGEAAIRDGHPNSVQLKLTGKSGETHEMIGESIGGSRINVSSIDGMTANFSGDYATLIVHNIDRPGLVAEVTSLLAREEINVATLQLYRGARGETAVMIIEVDQEISEETLQVLRNLKGIEGVTYFSCE